MDSKNTVILAEALLLIALLALLAWMVWDYKHRPVTGDPSGTAVIATPSPSVEGKDKVEVPCVPLQAHKLDVKEESSLPESVKKDPSTHVADVSLVPPSDRKQEIIVVVDSDTGDVSTYVQEKPLPWAAFNKKGEAGIYYGMKFGEQIVRVEVRQNLMQFKAIHVQLIGSLDQGTLSGFSDGFIGIGAVYRW